MVRDTAQGLSRIRVWDVPTRLVHWLMVILIPVSWWTAETGRMDYHRYSGYVLLGLLSFRIYWGFAGSSSARFNQFVKGPRAVMGYLRGERGASAGHNPLGALSVVALLLLLLGQITLGLFAVDVDGLESGPLSRFVSFDAGRVCAELHEKVFTILQAVIVLHVAAVLFYVLYRKQNLIAAMLHGKREYSQTPEDTVRFASVVRLMVGIVLAGVLTWIVVRA